MNLERYKQKVGIAQLTHILDEIGEQGLLSLIVEKLSEGTKPSDVARDLHLPFMVLWDWLAADTKRQQLYNHAWEMYAQDLHAETIQIADEATVEDVQVAKLRVDTRFKAASSYDRKRFGNSVKHEVEMVGVDIKQLLEQRRQKLEQVVEGVVLGKEVQNVERIVVGTDRMGAAELLGAEVVNCAEVVNVVEMAHCAVDSLEAAQC